MHPLHPDSGPQIKGVFDMALLHPRAALLQNFRVEQFCSRVLLVFGKIGVPSSRKLIFKGGKTLLPLV
jgi:hypothetical protein